MIGYTPIRQTMEMENFYRKHLGLRMTKYPSTLPNSRPLPIARKGQRFSAAEKMLAHREWLEQYSAEIQKEYSTPESEQK